MMRVSYPKILRLAQQLPPETQLVLADTLLHAYAGSQAADALQQHLTPIVGLSPAELQALAYAVVAADRQSQLQTLLERNQQGQLSPEEGARLDTLLAEVDHVALLKARALYTLHIFGGSTPSQL